MEVITMADGSQLPGPVRVIAHAAGKERGVYRIRSTPTIPLARLTGGCPVMFPLTRLRMRRRLEHFRDRQYEFCLPFAERRALKHCLRAGDGDR